MANNLYDTGAPQRVIVEHHVIHEERVVPARRPSRRQPRVEMDDVIDVTPERPQIEAPKGKK